MNFIVSSTVFRDFQILIDPKDQEKTTFTWPIRNGCFTAACLLAYANATRPLFQRGMMAIFHDMWKGQWKCSWMISRFLEILFLRLRSRIEGIVKSTKPRSICGFLVPSPTTVKGAVLGQRIEKHFRPIHYASKTMTEAETNYTTTEKEMLAVVYAFEKFRSYLIMNKSVVYTDHSALKYLFNKKDAKATILLRFDARGGDIISDRGTHFCNDKFDKVMSKYRVTHRLSTAYHPQTSGQVEISTSQSQENVHANQSSVIESLPVSPIPVEDSEPAQEEIDIFLVPDDLIPPGVENDNFEDEDNELPNLDHQDDPSNPRPLPEPPDVENCLEPEAGILITKMFKGVSKPYDFMADILPTLPTLVSNLTCILFLSSFLSFGSEDTIFDPCIITFPFSYLDLVAFSMAVSYVALPKDN
ncbi:reverse transcriptase domain-containing protein [Tanacetum coccineum]